MVKKINLIPGFVLYILFLFFGVSFCVAETGLNDKSETEQQVLLDDQVAISGKIIFEEYEEGLIMIRAYSEEPFMPSSIVAKQTIACPGKFKINVPKQFNEAYLEVICIGLDGSLSARGLYKNNPLRLSSSSVENIDIVLQGQLSPKIKGESVIISGNVIFDIYIDGPIRVSADKSLKGPTISWVEIDKPGRYSLEVPKNSGYSYIKVINVKQSLSGGKRPKGYRGGYKNNPLKIGSIDIDNVDIVIEDKLD